MKVKSFQVERLLKNPLKSMLLIYTIYLLVGIFNFFSEVVVPGLPISPNWVDRKWLEVRWISIWSLVYFLNYLILISLYKDVSFMQGEQIKGKYTYIYKNNNLIEELFNQSFRSYKPMILGFLFSFSELFAGKIMFGTVIPWLDDSIVMFFIGIVFYIFIYILYYVLKIGKILRQNFEKYDDSENIINLFKIIKQNEILAFGVLISKSILILSIISAILILPSFLDVFRYSYTFIGYLFIVALVVLPPLAFLYPMMNFHNTLMKSKEKALEYLNMEIVRTYKKIIDKEDISPSEKQRFEMLQELRKDVSSIHVWPINVKISYNLIFGSILPIIVSGIKEFIYFKNLYL